MLEGGSPQTSGFEVTGRAPLDYKSISASVAGMLATRAKYEGLSVYVRKGADPLTGKRYTLKSLAECGLSAAQIVLWGSLIGHWKVDGEASAPDLSAYARNDTGGLTMLLTPNPQSTSIVVLQPNGKGSVQSLVDQILSHLVALLSAPKAVNTVNSVTPDANGNVNVNVSQTTNSGIFAPVLDLATLKAIDTTDAAVWKDKWLINAQNIGLYYLDRGSTLTPDDAMVVKPNSITLPAPGRWVRRTDLPGVTYDATAENTADYTPFESNNATGFFSGLLAVATGKLKLKPALDRIVTRLNAKPDAAVYSRSLFVTPSGSNATALTGRMDRPFATISAANAASLSGDTIFVYPGIYVEQNVIRNNINYHFSKGAVVLPGNTLPCINDSSGPINSVIRGQGRFMGKGYGLNDTTAVMVGNTSKLDIECDLIESMECWNPNAIVIVRRARITFEMTAYNGGGIILENCQLVDSVNTVFGNGLIRARNTHFENSIRQHPDYGTINVSASPGFVNERSPVTTNICMGTGVNGAGAGRLMLDNCTLVSQHENVTFINSGNTVAHKDTNMFVNLLSAGTVVGGEAIVPACYRNRVAAIQPVSFMGMSYANADVSPIFVHNNLFGAGISVDPELNRLFLESNPFV